MMTIGRCQVPVPVVERYEGHAVADTGDACGGGHRAARRADLDEVAFVDAEPRRVRFGELDPHLGRRVTQLRSTSGLGSGVEVIQRAAGVEHEWHCRAGWFVWRQVFGRLYDGLAIRI